MKKLLLLSIVLWSMNLGLQAQQLFFEVSSGYNITAYEGVDYAESAGYVPIRVRLAGGFEHVQLGVEFDTDITRPEFDFFDETTNELAGRQDFENKYYGLFVRGNLSSLPAYRFGVILSAGAGLYNSDPKYISLPDGEEVVDLGLEPTLGYNFRVGISSPIYTLLHWELGYQFNYMNYEKDADGILLMQEFQPYYHSIQAGLSLNLVFGNVEKKCRRVMSSNRSKKGW